MSDLQGASPGLRAWWPGVGARPAAPAILALLALLMVWLAHGMLPSRTRAGTHGRDAQLMAARTAGVTAQAARPATVVRPVSCEPLSHVPGMSITTAIVEFPPGAYSPRHRHPGSVTAYVLQGTLRSQLAGEPVGTYTVGQTWFEPSGAIHLFAENASAAEPAELLAVFITDSDCGPLVIPDPG